MQKKSSELKYIYTVQYKSAYYAQMDSGSLDANLTRHFLEQLFIKGQIIQIPAGYKQW